MEIFKYGMDRKDIGPLASASLSIVWPSGDFLPRATPKSLTCQKNARRTRFQVEFVFTSWPSQSHREAILSNRDIVLLSCDRLGFATRMQYEGDAMLPDHDRKAT